MTTEKVSFQTVEYMQRLILELDEANTQLRLEAKNAAADERAKIVAHIFQVADRIKNDPDGKVWGHLHAMAVVIEAGEHLI